MGHLLVLRLAGRVVTHSYVSQVASGLRVAVTGSAGFVGTGLVERLAASDEVGRVVALDVLPVDSSHPKVVAFQQDIQQPIADILRRHGVDAIVHLAFVLRSGRNREAARQANLGGTARVLRECREAGVRHLVYLSSTTVYGPHLGDSQPYTEDSPVRPVRGFHYAEDKAATELMLEGYAADNPDTCVTVLRACTIMGPRGENLTTRTFRKLSSVRVRGADPQMQFLHEDDLQEALGLCLRERICGVYNVTGEGTVSYSEVARIAGRRSVAMPAPVLAGLAQAMWTLRLQSDAPGCGVAMLRWPWVASNEKMARENGFRPRYGSREVLMHSALAKRNMARPAPRPR